MTPRSKRELSQRFERFAKEVFAGSSPLYEELCLRTAADHDPEVLDLASHAPPEQPVPVLLFAAVHFLLLAGDQHRLSNYYPDITTRARRAESVASGEPYALFKAFCRRHKAAIREIITTRTVQTNEVQRCACLVPAFSLIADEAPEAPLALIEVGASAGLNLLWDKYGYDYGEGRHFGDIRSPVQILCTPRGGVHPAIPTPFPKVAFRTGIDLDPIHVHDERSARWLRALLWPEHEHRFRLLEAALLRARRDPPPLVAGDLFDRLPEVLDWAPSECTVCVFHTFTLYQCTPQASERLSSLLAEWSLGREVFLISMEPRGSESSLEITWFEHGLLSRRKIADADHHGRWLRWLWTQR